LTSMKCHFSVRKAANTTSTFGDSFNSIFKHLFVEISKNEKKLPVRWRGPIEKCAAFCKPSDVSLFGYSKEVSFLELFWIDFERNRFKARVYPRDLLVLVSERFKRKVIVIHSKSERCTQLICITAYS
jgi:hypothetical protein